MMQRLSGDVDQQLTSQLLDRIKDSNYQTEWSIWIDNTGCTMKRALPWDRFVVAFGVLCNKRVIEKQEDTYKLKNEYHLTDLGFQTEGFSDDDLVRVCRLCTDEKTITELILADLKNYLNYMTEIMRQKLLRIRALEEAKWSREWHEIEAQVRG